MDGARVGLGDLPLDKGIAADARSGADFFDQLTMPAAAIIKPILERNSGWMRHYIQQSGVSIAPHGKTTMIPEIFRMQIADGAWAITLSTLQQVRVGRHFGINRIFLANVLADPREIAAIFAELEDDPSFDFYCLIDSVDALQALVDGFAAGPWRRPINVLVELGYPGGRTGCRSVPDALALARRAAQAGEGVRLVGVEGFEGLINPASESHRDARIRDFVRSLADLAEAADAEKLFSGEEKIVSAGGTGFIDLVVSGLSRLNETAPRFRLLIRSGCYIAFDTGQYRDLFKRMAQRGSPGFSGPAPVLESALEVWARVLSRPEPGRLILGAGKRDLGQDVDIPRLVKWLRPGLHSLPQSIPEGCRVVELNDQHAHVEVASEVPLRFGDFVGLGVSHPCTTFDKWRKIQVVDGGYRIVETFQTYF